MEAEAQAKLNNNSNGTNSTNTSNPMSPTNFNVDDVENISPSISFASLFNSQSKSNNLHQSSSDRALYLLTNNSTCINSTNDIFKNNTDNNDIENAKYSTTTSFEIDLLKQFAFLDIDSNTNTSSNANNNNNNILSGRKITNSVNNIQSNSTTSIPSSATNNNLTSLNNIQPLGTRNLNITTAQNNTKTQIQTTTLNDNCTFAKEIASNILSTKSSMVNKNSNQCLTAEVTTKLTETIDIDQKSSAWFNYLLDKASRHTTSSSNSSNNLLKQNNSLSGSSSPLSPTMLNTREHSPTQGTKSHHNSNSIEQSLSSNSVILYRSLNTSNTIFVQPTDILEPLEVGDFNEYKLFPSTSSESNAVCGSVIKGLSMSSPNKLNDNDYTKEIEILVELTPPSSVSLSSSSSSTSSSSSSGSSASSLLRALNVKSSPISSQKFRSRGHAKC